MTTTSMMDIKEIMSSLPHRYPFLLVDRVIEFEPWKSLTAIKNVTINEPYFQGHFPSEPIMPGVLILEALAQAAGITLLKSDPSLTHEENLFLLAGIDNARFKRMVIPGDQLTLKVELMRSKGGIYKFSCQALVQDELACSADIINVKRRRS